MSWGLDICIIFSDMENMPTGGEYKEQTPLSRVRKVCDTKEEAIKLVREFWEAMPHGADIMGSVTNGDWEQELTMGDRTFISSGMLRGERGKFVAVFQGNHQPLSREAEAWLRNRGLIA